MPCSPYLPTLLLTTQFLYCKKIHKIHSARVALTLCVIQHIAVIIASRLLSSLYNEIWMTDLNANFHVFFLIVVKMDDKAPTRPSNQVVWMTDLNSCKLVLWNAL